MRHKRATPLASRLLVHHGPSKHKPPLALRDVPLADAVYTRLLRDPETVLTSAALDDTVIRLWQRTGSVGSSRDRPPNAGRTAALIATRRNPLIR